MDGNKDEALKCLRIGKEAIESGDRARALKFISKASRLDPSLNVDDLLSKIRLTDSDDHPTASEDSSSHGIGRPDLGSTSSPGPRHRFNSSSNEPSTKEYSEEQITIIRQIKRQKDYYQILGLERGCSVEDVRKAYRKLSLKVHPDKNKAPGAEEAFKSVSKAFQCLNNEDKRRIYDANGTEEEPTYVRNAARRDMNGFGGYYDAEFDADEIFRNFFFGGMHQPTSYNTFRFRTGGRGVPAYQDTQGSGGFNIRVLMQLLPVLLIFLLNFLPSSDPPYVLSRHYPYEQRLETHRGVPFYVKPEKFEEEYVHGSVKRMELEEKIEREYVQIVAHHCRNELQQQRWGFTKGTPYCDMLRKYEAAVKGTA